MNESDTVWRGKKNLNVVFHKINKNKRGIDDNETAVISLHVDKVRIRLIVAALICTFAACVLFHLFLTAPPARGTGRTPADPEQDTWPESLQGLCRVSADWPLALFHWKRTPTGRLHGFENMFFFVPPPPPPPPHTHILLQHNTNNNHAEWESAHTGAVC